METLNSIGFTNFWGVTPAYNILKNEFFQNMNTNNKPNSVNILISNSNDIRHILKTISNTFEKKENWPQLNFFIFESFRENIARCILFLHIIHDTKISIRDRIEILMEIYGNTLLSSRTAEYLNSIYKDLIKFVTSDKKYKSALDKIVDLSQLTYKEKDELVEIFSSYDLKCEYDIEKYRDDRLRFMYKERYDFRDNMADWDYQMNLKLFAPIINLRHYTDFRRTGVSFEMRISKYNVPNRTMGSYLPGREKKSKDSCLVRGFWADLVNSPFIGFGVELDSELEFSHFYKNNNINYIYDAQEITEFNLSKFLFRMEKDELFDFLTKEKERKKLKEKQKLEEEANSENTINNKINEDIIFENKNETPTHILDSSFVDESSHPLIAFQNLNVKIIPLSGNLESFIKKKKYENFFDFIVMGLYSKNILPNLSQISKKHMKLFLELNSFMTSFNDTQKNEFKEKMKNLTKENNLILEDTSSKHMWKFFLKNKNIEAIEEVNSTIKLEEIMETLSTESSNTVSSIKI